MSLTCIHSTFSNFDHRLKIRPQEDEMMLNTDVKQCHVACGDNLPWRSVPCRGPQPTPEPSPPDRSHSAPAHKQDKRLAKLFCAKESYFKATVSWDRFLKFRQKFTEASVRARQVFQFFMCSNDFITQKVYFLRLIDKSGLACWMSCTVVGAVLVVFSGVDATFAQSSSQWEARADSWRNVPNPADQ